MGISGNAIYCQIINQLLSHELHHESEITIHVFEARRDHFATGAAYRVDAPEIWTLNNAAKDFKFIPETKALDEWITENLASLRMQFPTMNETYCPRALVGLYLKAQYANHKRKAEFNGIKIVEHFEKMLDFDLLEGDRWALKTPTLQMQSDFLFLCFGHIPAHHYPHLESKPGYYTESTPLSIFEEIPQSAPIYIIGGQASFVDYAIWLAVTKNHQGILTSLTRNPSIITTKGNTDSCDTASLEELKKTLTYQAPSTLSYSSARDSFWDAYKVAAEDKADPLEKLSTYTALSYQLAKYDKGAVLSESAPCINVDKLRAFIKAFYFNGAYEAFWMALNDEGKASFNQLMYSHIMAFLTGITPLNTRLLLALYDRGSVVEKAGLTAIDYDEKSKAFLLRFATGETEKANYLIDASGYSYDIRHCNKDMGFIHEAATKGLLVPKSYGGIEINDAGQPKNRRGQVQRTLFCIGPVASFNDKYPTPHASFLVFNASEKVVERFIYELNEQKVNHLQKI